MKTYTDKTVEACLEQASKDLNLPVDQIVYNVAEERKSLFKKTATISIYEVEDAVEYASKYILDVCKALGLEANLKPVVKDEFIKIFIETDHNSLLIGRGGTTLQALNELVKLALSFKFKKKYRILLDISGYKDKRYGQIISKAKRIAKEVLKTHVAVKLDSMTPDERKKIHTALASWKNIKTESVGDGKDRSVVISYSPTPASSSQQEVATEKAE